MNYSIFRFLAFSFVAVFYCLLGIAPLHAQSIGNTLSATQGEAYLKCQSNGAAAIAYYQPNQTTQTLTHTCTRWGTEKRYWGELRGSVGGHLAGYNHSWTGQSCADQPSIQNVRFTGNAGACSGGCSYAADTGGSITVTTIAGQQITKASLMTPTGQACTIGETPAPVPTDQDTCVQDTTLTQCTKGNGDVCAVGKSGKQYCWKPGEAGVKTDHETGNEAATLSPTNQTTNAPRQPPKNGGDWQVTGQGNVSITNITNGNSTTNNYNTTTFQSSYGSQGTGSTGTGSGSGNGTGGGDGSGNGDGSGDGDGEGDGPGAPGGTLGDLYTPPHTMEQLVSQHFTRVMATPFLSSIRGFYTIHGGGSCPTWSLAATQWTPQFTLDFHCSGAFLAAIQAAGWLVLAIATYLAIRIAIT